MVVERIPEDMLKIKNILEKNGIKNLTFVQSAYVAKQILLSGDFYDLCFIDDLTPKDDLSCSVFCKEIKQRLNYSMPIIFLTSMSNDSEKVELIRTGAHGFVSKPLHERVLMNHVKSALKISNYQGRVSNVKRGLKQNRLRFQILPRNA